MFGFRRSLLLSLLLLAFLQPGMSCAQSDGVGQMVEWGVLLGATLFQANHNAMWSPEFETNRKPRSERSLSFVEIIDEIELPDEDECPDSISEPLKGSAGGMQVSVCGDRAAFRLPDKTHSDHSSYLSQIMKRHSLHEVSVQPSQIDIFKKKTAEPSISVAVPFIDEPVSLISGHEWLVEYTGLAYVTIKTMEAIAAIAEAALSARVSERLVDIEEADYDFEEDSEPIWFDVNELGGMLYATETVPKKPPEYDKVEILQEDNTVVIELGSGIESIKLYVGRNQQGQVFGGFEHLARKAGGDGKDDKKVDGDRAAESSTTQSSNQASNDEPSKSTEGSSDSASTFTNPSLALGSIEIEKAIKRSEDNTKSLRERQKRNRDGPDLEWDENELYTFNPDKDKYVQRGPEGLLRLTWDEMKEKGYMVGERVDIPPEKRTKRPRMDTHLKNALGHETSKLTMEMCQNSPDMCPNGPESKVRRDYTKKLLQRYSEIDEQENRKIRVALPVDRLHLLEEKNLVGVKLPTNQYELGKVKKTSGRMHTVLNAMKTVGSIFAENFFDSSFCSCEGEQVNCYWWEAWLQYDGQWVADPDAYCTCDKNCQNR